MRELQMQGFRITEPRQAVMEVLKNASGHPSAEEIYFLVHRNNPGVGLATIYRILDLLVKTGLIRRYDFGQGKARYELVRQDGSHHHHLICRNCGRIIDYDDFLDQEKELVGKIEAALSKKHNFKIESHNLIFYGLCSKCRH